MRLLSVALLLAVTGLAFAFLISSQAVELRWSDRDKTRLGHQHWLVAMTESQFKRPLEDIPVSDEAITPKGLASIADSFLINVGHASSLKRFFRGAMYRLSYFGKEGHTWTNLPRWKVEVGNTPTLFLIQRWDWGLLRVVPKVQEGFSSKNKRHGPSDITNGVSDKGVFRIVYQLIFFSLHRQKGSFPRKEQ